MADRTLAHYRLIERLGAGGMGEVWRATDTRLGRDVALKLLPRECTVDAERLARFQREARALATLDHPGIVTVFSIEQDGDQHFLTMALVGGRTLAQVIAPGGLPLADVLGFASRLADALAAAHDHGIVHRDLKPGNIMVGSDSRLKVLDFGLAKLVAGATEGLETVTAEPALTREGGFVGTLPYMSPEQIEGRDVDNRSDLYSLGVIIHEMASGRRPFAGDSQAALISAILRDRPPALRTLRAGLPAELERLVERCLEKDPRRRHESARALGGDLQALAVKATMLAGAGAAKAGPRPATSRAVAVLPLTNLSRDPAEDYFADGMTEALITDLAKLGGFKVISRTSVMRFKGSTLSLRDIARELGVSEIVQGSILRSADRVRISAQLISADTEDHLWADRYDRDLADVLALHDEVARAIAEQVGVRLKTPAAARPAPARRVDPEVYRLYLQGRHYWNMRTEASFNLAARTYRKALDIDATWAPAWVGLAESLNMLSNYGLQHTAQVAGQARDAIERALELDESSADAHRTRAFIMWTFDYDWGPALSEYERALELDPSSDLTHYFYGLYLGVIGQFDRSHALLARAAELDPLSLVIPSAQGWVFMFARRFADAERALRRVLEVDPEFFLANWWLGEALVELGKHDEGIASLEKALSLSKGISRLVGYLGYAYGVAGRADEARRQLAELRERERAGYVPPYFFALVHCGLGEKEHALDRLEQAYAVRDTMLRDLKADPHWDRLAGEPRLLALIERMAYPPA